MSSELAARERIFTAEEYLTLERAADYRSEFVKGRIYAMSGGTPEHSLISGNVNGELRNQLKRKPCRVFNSDLMLRTTTTGLFSYPDAWVVCGELRFHDQKRDVVTNPIVVVEVLSRSTADFDRGTKFALYKEISELQNYVMIYQDRAEVECHHRRPNGEWDVSIVSGRDASIDIPAIECALALAEIYDKVDIHE